MLLATSAGAVVGSIYAAGRNASQLEQEALALDKFDLADFVLSRKGLIKGEKLQNYINSKVGNKPLQSLPRKFAAVTTDMDTGEMIIFLVAIRARLYKCFLPVSPMYFSQS